MLIRNPVFLAAALALAACGEPKPPPATPARFEADPQPSGAALWTEGELNADGTLTVTVWAQQLGPVLGYAFRLAADPSLTPLAGQAISAEPTLGPNAFGEAIYLAKLGPGGLSVGAARQGPAAGERDLTAPTVAARLTLVPGTSEASVALRDVSVRRSSGDSLSVTLAGGRFFPGSAP
jgi:hypothetical protein